MSNFDEMVGFLEHVARVNRAVTWPFIEKKTGLKVVSEGADFGEIVTEVDKGVSLYLLNGGIEGISGVRAEYPGSFSEEDDTEKRPSSLKVIQIDPLDGTGDFKKTYKTENVIGPTTLVSKLARESPEQPFSPVAGIIFDIKYEIALVSDGKDIGLFNVSDGKIAEVKYGLVHPEWSRKAPLFINKRYSYPQNNFDEFCDKYLPGRGLKVKRIPVGGAGTIAMQFFRQFIEPKQPTYFSELRPITICFNAQPDWKTWDTDPTEVIANALGLPERRDIYGAPLKANAANPTLKDMHHTNGYVLAPNDELRSLLTGHAAEFQRLNPGKPLTEKNY